MRDTCPRPAQLQILCVCFPAMDAANPLQLSLASHATEFQTFWHVNTPDDNRGYTRAMNRLMRQTRAHFLLLLNQDVQILPDTIAKALEFMHAHPRCAIAGFKQVHPERPDEITHGGTGPAYPWGVHLGGLVSRGDCAVPRQFDWINGAAMIVRSAALPSIRLMDERFFMFYSDGDWCLTARQKGWQVWYCADAMVKHVGGASLTNSPERDRIFLADQAAFAAKWQPKLHTPAPAPLGVE